jgi:hypothetical protein
VEKTCDFLVGMVVLRVISLVITPPRVSMPRLQARQAEQAQEAKQGLSEGRVSSRGFMKEVGPGKQGHR